MSQQHKFRKGKSLFSTTLSVGISTGTGETIALSSTVGLPTDTEITLTFDRVDADGGATPVKVERITGIVSGSNIITYTRAIDQTTEQAHSAGAVVEYIWNADDLGDLIDGILAEHSQTGKHTKNTVTTYNPIGAGTTTINVALGNINTVTLPAATQTLAISNETDGQCFIIEINNVTSQEALTWFTTIRWVDGTAPTLTGTNGKRDVFGFRVTGADTYDGYVVGQNI